METKPFYKFKTNGIYKSGNFYFTHNFYDKNADIYVFVDLRSKQKVRLKYDVIKAMSFSYTGYQREEWNTYRLLYVD